MLSLLPAALAQDTAPAADTGEEEIIVTAQRVRENVQKVPLSVSAFNASKLEDMSIATLSDLAMRVPGFSMTVVDPIQSNYAIRGIGSAHGISQNAGGDPSVVVFVDGVYAGRGGTPDIDALMLERVEVLRGPQGTLFGKNAVGGLVQFVSKRPSEENEYMLEATIGNYDKLNLKGYANWALSDKAFLSAAVANKSRSGYTYNATTGNHTDDEKLTTAQFQFRFLPTEDLDILLGFDITHQDQLGNPRDNICDYVGRPASCVGVDPDPRIVNAYIDGKLKRDLRTYRAEINWDTSIGTFTSITAYRESEIETLTPFFSNPLTPTFPRTQIESTEVGIEDNSQFSQELRLAFDAFDSRLTGQVGVYYLSEDNNRVQDLIQDFGTAAISGRARYPQYVDATSFAVFGQFNYAITDTLTATVGARMTWEEKDGYFAGFKTDTGPGIPPPLGAAGNYAVNANQEWEAFTPRFAINWQVTDDALLYASATRGYKSGGFQGISGTALGAATPYDPEYAWGYEVGAKTRWFDNMLQLNLSVFQTDYENLQNSQLVPLCCVVVSNAATARIRGVELEFVVRPVEGFQIDGSYGYLDAEFLDFVIGAANNTGKDIPRSPKNKFNIGAQYVFDIAEWQAKARVDYYVQSKMYFDAANTRPQMQEGYDTIDARLTFTAPDDAWEVALWGKNLTDELVRTYATYYGPFNQTLVPYQPPLTYGLTLTFRQ